MAVTVGQVVGIKLAVEVPIPDGYVITAGACSRVASKAEERLVSSAPVLVAGIGVDVDTGTCTVTLTWPTGAGPRRRWHRLTCGRDVVMSTRAIVGLAAQGLPVSSMEAGELVMWIRYQERIWQEASDPQRQTRRLGWHGSGFLLGARSVGEAPEWRAEPSDGVDQWVAAIRQRGTLRGQAAALLELLDAAPMLRLVVAAAASAPMLRPLGAPGFALELARRSSQGKTTSCRLAMAMWGDASDQGLLRGWDTTRVGVERLGAAAHDVPIWLDDTKRAPSTAYVDSVVYDVTSGAGKLRGAVKGAAQSATYRTVLLTTGESSITGESQSGGIRGRVLSWQGLLLPSAAVADRVNDAVGRDFGHIGPLLVERIIRGVDESRWRELRAWYASRVPVGHPTGDRLASYAATLAYSGEVLADALDVERHADWWLSGAAWASMLGATSTADRAEEALRDLLGHIAATDAWYETGRRPPTGGWFGRIVSGRMCILPSAGRAWAERSGYSWTEMLAGWRDRGWWSGSNSSMRIDDSVVRAVAVEAAALADLGLAESPDASPF